MEIATTLTALVPTYVTLCFMSEPYIPNRAEYENALILKQCTGSFFREMKIPVKKTRACALVSYLDFSPSLIYKSYISYNYILYTTKKYHLHYLVSQNTLMKSATHH